MTTKAFIFLSEQGEVTCVYGPDGKELNRKEFEVVDFSDIGREICFVCGAKHTISTVDNITTCDWCGCNLDDIDEPGIVAKRMELNAQDAVDDMGAGYLGWHKNSVGDYENADEFYKDIHIGRTETKTEWRVFFGSEPFAFWPFPSLIDACKGVDRILADL